MSGDDLARERIERFFAYMIDGRGTVMEDGFSREEMIVFRDLVLKRFPAAGIFGLNKLRIEVEKETAK